MRPSLAASSILLAAFTATGCFYDTSGDPAPQPDSGVGAFCADDGDCEQYEEATLCVLNPMNPSDPGFCSLDGCEAGECPSELPHCCDCSSLDWIVTCLDDDTYGMASSYGCTCD